jgi:hypothetical protein
MRSIPLALTWALLGLAACRDRSAQTPVRSAGSDAAGDPSSAAPSRELEVTVNAEVPDAGMLAIPFFREDRPEIPPARALLVETNLPLQNYRVRVFDEADRAMVSDDDAEDADGGVLGVRYRIEFPEPLKTGHRYAVVVDAQTGPELLDSLGRPHDDVRLEFRIAGEKVKPQQAPPKRRRRR